VLKKATPHAIQRSPEIRELTKQGTPRKYAKPTGTPVDASLALIRCMRGSADPQPAPNEAALACILESSQPSAESHQLAAHSRAANRRRDLIDALEAWVEAEAEARLAAWVRELRSDRKRNPRTLTVSVSKE
jgi:hypothetical protein